jgi:hypothetical protein
VIDEHTRSEWAAAEKLHHAYLTGILLFLVQSRGGDVAADFVFRTFRRQHLSKFLPALETLSLRGLPDAVACAHFIYLANRAGGVLVETMPESDKKAWVRYPPPRWIYEGASICAIPSQVSIAFLRAFHAHCGVSLGNPRLGFVCTALTTDGAPGLEGYFQEYDHDLAEDERLRFEPGERAPLFDADLAPALSFKGERLHRARRNYALQYIRVGLPVLCDLLGGDASAQRRPAVLVGMQLYEELCSVLGPFDRDQKGFGDFLAALLRGCGDEPRLKTSANDVSVSVSNLRVLARDADRTAFDAWNALWSGALSVHNRDLQLEVESRVDKGDLLWTWVVSS